MPPKPSRQHSLAALSTLASVSSAGVAFLVNILMARTLGPSARGEVAWALQTAYVVTPFLCLGIDRISLKGGHKDQAFSEGHVWLLTATLLLFSAACRSPMLAVCVATAAIGSSLAIQRGTGIGRGSLNAYIAHHLGIQTWILGASTLLWLGNIQNTSAWGATYALPAGLLFVRYMLKRRNTDKSKKIYPSRASAAYMFGGIGQLLAARIERIMLPALSSTSQLGLYISVATASEMVVWLARGIGDSRIATTKQGYHTKATLLTIAGRNLALFTLASTIISIGIYYLLIPALGAGFTEARSLIAPLAAASAVWGTYLQVSAIWLATTPSRVSARLDITAAIVTTLVTAPLIILYGAMGASVGCLLAYSILLTLSIALYPNNTNLEVVR